MNLPLLILRPIEGARETADRAIRLGLNPVLDPLFQIEAVDWHPPPVDAFDALLITSANAIKYAGSNLARYRDLPVLAVGDASAEAARSVGLKIELAGNGGAQDVIDALQGDKYRRILRLTGLHHKEIEAGEISLTTEIVYQSTALPLGNKARSALQSDSVIALHSARAAGILNEQIEGLQLDKAGNHIVAFSQKIADAAGDGWKSVSAASTPTDEALLSIAARLCRGDA